MRLGALVCILALGCRGSHQPTATVTPASKSSPTGSPAAVAQTAEKPAEPVRSTSRSLYERLGGQPAVAAVIEEFVTRTTANDKIRDRFFNVDEVNLKKLLAQFVCRATGGGCEYEGRDLGLVHAGMDLSGDEFDALAADLAGALDKLKVPEKEKRELLTPIAALKPQIVADPAKLESQKLDAKRLDVVATLAAAPQDPEVRRLLELAVVAGGRGQRSYAEQLFTRAEMIAGAKTLAAVAPTFRAGAPERVTTETHKMEDKGPQPEVVGKEDEADAPKPKTPNLGTLHGALRIDQKAPEGLGVVMLSPEKGGFARRTPKHRVVEQRNRTFLPHVTAVPVGSTVSFPNFDSIYHNVFSRSSSKSFDLGMYKSGQARDVKFDKPGIVRLGCNLHAHMAAYIVVVDAPHYVVIDADGTYAFKGLVPGTYTLRAWHEPSGEPYVTLVEVKEGDNTQDLDVRATTFANPDKFGQPR
jgi:truncated hemoglobin YjbI/plastocyanin